MALLTAKTFSLQFNNKRRIKRPYYPRKALLCYQLTPQNGSTPTRGYFKNKKKCHAEIRFINEIKSMGLDETQCYQVTCYLTWSPCPSCVRELVAFIKAHDHLNLRIFASRLYCHWCRRQQEGLRLLCGSQVPVEVMGSRGRKEALQFQECKSPGAQAWRGPGGGVVWRRLAGGGGSGGIWWEARKEGLWLSQGPRSDTTWEGEFPGQSNVQGEEEKRRERKQELLALQLLPLGPGWFPSSLSEFADCWENFVDHKEPLSFNPSEMLEELDKNSRAIKRRLERIKQSWSVDVLENGLRSLQLGPVSSSLSRSNSR
ncbi:DNA dC-_dU-editing enzyme APOBEC-3H isoform X1 [Pongo pygmaeus]|uniref:DNA dC->dU-editing enzyme APOBEC-3H isoform X1 n=1 Tax=Pongo pygmaeus TaxID=9600 RepID=UPI0023E302C6|nr:DNA dC->dU-editing enzyme APOBEC-3H isoform X1 [Pongo pygmaeus]XP_054326438.1 DNA dC->dU-editing enzyme APOBEC-3H isoform X1 [Pongo pygmaeus]